MVKEPELEEGRWAFLTFRRTASVMPETRFEPCCNHSFQYFERNERLEVGLKVLGLLESCLGISEVL